MRKGRKNKILTRIIEQEKKNTKKKETHYISLNIKKKKNTPSYHNFHHGEASKLSIMKRNIPLQWTVRRGLFARVEATLSLIRK